jgi:aminoglycoside phosphotransferase (APT) family kinase protein
MTRADLAKDGHAVLDLVGARIEDWLGFRAEGCRPEVLKQTDRKMVVRYDLEGGGRAARLIGKWYSTDQGELVGSTLQALFERGFADELAVPRPVVYLPQERVLFMEAIDGVLLRKVLDANPVAARRAGEWLAAFHRSDLRIPRHCGPEKQRRSVDRWGRTHASLRKMASALTDALSSLPDPKRPVHYDYYQSQVLLSSERTVVLDLDESGMGDPDFDRAHFEAHLRLLALKRHGTPNAFDSALLHFRDGYSARAGTTFRTPPQRTLEAFAWFKLAYQALRRNAPAVESQYALDSARESLAAT